MPQYPERLPNGNLKVPVAGSTEDGTFVDGFTEIGPEHPDYEKYLAYLAQQERSERGEQEEG